MGGRDGNRGYLIQTIIALLRSLVDESWSTVTVEPDIAQEKVDIIWERNGLRTAVQVKSSINQIGKADAERWATELKRDSEADAYELHLIGPCSQSVIDLVSVDGVLIPPPKNLDIDGLLAEGAHSLSGFLIQNRIDQKSPKQRELIVLALTTRLSALSINGCGFSREELSRCLAEWVSTIAAPSDSSWELVTFNKQRGIENALAGKRLGPSDVEACSEFAICSEIVRELDRSHSYQITGTSGCGKSITAWQTAYRFYKRGFAVWRPRPLRAADQLLADLPQAAVQLIVIDDAQQYGSEFAARVSELSNADLKVLLVSTVEAILLQQILCLPVERCVADLVKDLRNRRNEILPLIQQYDDWVGNRTHEISYERRVTDAGQEKQPSDFFWVLRGGWRTASREFESVEQFAGAIDILLIIAIGQIASCDAGVSHAWMASNARHWGHPEKLTNDALNHLSRLGLVISDEVLRTKHLTYANKIVEKCFDESNSEHWDRFSDIYIQCILSSDWSLKGITWSLGNSATGSDAFRCRLENFRRLAEPVANRCLLESEDFEWAAACYSRVFSRFNLPATKLQEQFSVFMQWIASSTGKWTASFCGDIVNELLNRSSRNAGIPNYDSAKEFIDKIDYKVLVRLAHANKIDGYYSFGTLLDRCAMCRPAWSESFISELDWNSIKIAILRADADSIDSVDKLVTAFSMLSSTKDGTTLRYIEDIVPYLHRAINGRPVNAIAEMHGILWLILPYAPSFLRGGRQSKPDERELAGKIVSGIDAKSFAAALSNPISRDLEGLARSFEFIAQVDSKFTTRLASELPEHQFLQATDHDWAHQSSELVSLIRFFICDEYFLPASKWIRDKAAVIQGPLCPMFTFIAPDVAITFWKSGRGIAFVEKYEQRWWLINRAIARLAKTDELVACQILEDKLDEFRDGVYQVTLEPGSLIQFFNILHRLSPEAFDRFAGMLNLDDDICAKTIEQVVRNQPGQLPGYRRLARIGIASGGRMSTIALELHKRLFSVDGKV